MNSDSFKFSCPVCNHHIEADYELAGENVKCPHCKTDITVPLPDNIIVPKTILTTKPGCHAPDSNKGFLRIYCVFLMLLACYYFIPFNASAPLSQTIQEWNGSDEGVKMFYENEYDKERTQYYDGWRQLYRKDELVIAQAKAKGELFRGELVPLTDSEIYKDVLHVYGASRLKDEHMFVGVFLYHLYRNGTHMLFISATPLLVFYAISWIIGGFKNAKTR